MSFSEANSCEASMQDDSATRPVPHDDSATYSMEAAANEALCLALASDADGATGSMFHGLNNEGIPNPAALSVSLSRSEGNDPLQEMLRGASPPQAVQRGSLLAECRGLKHDLATLRGDVSTLVAEQSKWILKMNRVVKKVLPAMVAAVASNNHYQSVGTEVSTSDSRGDSPVPGTPSGHGLVPHALVPVALVSLQRTHAAVGSMTASQPDRESPARSPVPRVVAVSGKGPTVVPAQPQSTTQSLSHVVARGSAITTPATGGHQQAGNRGAECADDAWQGIADIEAHIRHLKARPMDLSHPTVNGVAHGGPFGHVSEALGAPQPHAVPPGGTPAQRASPQQHYRHKRNSLRPDHHRMGTHQQAVLTLTCYGPPDLSQVVPAPHRWALGTSTRHHQLAIEEAQLADALRFSSLRTATASPPQPHGGSGAHADADIETNEMLAASIPRHTDGTAPATTTTTTAAAASRALTARLSVSPPDDPLHSATSWLQRGIQVLHAPLQAIGTAVLRSTGSGAAEGPPAADDARHSPAHPPATSVTALAPQPPHPPLASPRNSASLSASRVKRGLVMAAPPGGEAGGRQRPVVSQHQRGPFAVVVGRGGATKPFERFANSSSGNCNNASTLTDIPTAWTPPMSSSGRRGPHNEPSVVV